MEGQGKIVYLFAPAFLQGLASLFLVIPLLPQRIQSHVHIGFVPRRWHSLLLMLFVIFWLGDAHLRSNMGTSEYGSNPFNPQDSLIYQTGPNTSVKSGCSCSICEKRCISGRSHCSRMVGIRSYSMQP